MMLILRHKSGISSKAFQALSAVYIGTSNNFPSDKQALSPKDKPNLFDELSFSISPAIYICSSLNEMMPFIN